MRKYFRYLKKIELSFFELFSKYALFIKKIDFSDIFIIKPIIMLTSKKNINKIII